MKNVHILTGKVHSGKTTGLMKWAVTQPGIDGIFQPVIDEKRFIYHPGSRTLKSLETDEMENITPIGKFKFSNETFEWSRNILRSCTLKDLQWIVIDEIGPLELEGKGLEPVITEILDMRENIRSKILSVVREEILQKFIDHYNLHGCYEIFQLPV